MFRVPLDAQDPTFDRVEKVSLRRWITSSKAERAEWKRRRDLAAAVAKSRRAQRAAEMGARRQAERASRAESLRQAEIQASQANRWRYPDGGI